MTKQTADRSQSKPNGAGAGDITAAMIGAGIDAYLKFCPDSGVGDLTHERMVGEIYREMLAASFAPHGVSVNEPH